MWRYGSKTFCLYLCSCLLFVLIVGPTRANPMSPPQAEQEPEPHQVEHQEQLQLQYQHQQQAMRQQQQQLHADEDIPDAYRLVNELKPEHSFSSPTGPVPWSPFGALNQFSSLPTSYPRSFGDFTPYFAPKLPAFFAYSHPLLIPYPLVLAPDVLYPANFVTASGGGVGAGVSSGVDTAEESMSRSASTRRHHTPRNSPIFYVRLQSTPYMFMPNFGYTPPPPSPPTPFAPLLPYQPLSGFSGYSPMLNLPLSFVANGKPTNIYRMGGSPADIQTFGGIAAADKYGSIRPVSSVQHPLGSPLVPARPALAHPSYSNYSPQQTFGLSSPPAPQQESKLTSLKHPFVFNGRPEEIYILQNHYNPLYSNPNFY